MQYRIRLVCGAGTATANKMAQAIDEDADGQEASVVIGPLPAEGAASMLEGFFNNEDIESMTVERIK
jgi:cellobiose-specific phosphotransferase system component IIB